MTEPHCTFIVIIISWDLRATQQAFFDSGPSRSWNSHHTSIPSLLAKAHSHSHLRCKQGVGGRRALVLERGMESVVLATDFCSSALGRSAQIHSWLPGKLKLNPPDSIEQQTKAQKLTQDVLWEATHRHGIVTFIKRVCHKGPCTCTDECTCVHSGALLPAQGSTVTGA